MTHRDIHKAVLEKVSIFKMFEMGDQVEISHIDLDSKVKINKIKLDELMS